MTSENLKRIAADSNALLSAVSGGAARKVFLKAEIEVVTTHFNIDEVLEYIPRMALKYHVEKESLFLQLKMLPLEIVDETEYKQEMASATQFLENKDPDDIPLLALALQQKIPVWSNDKDFENLPITVYTTARLLKILESK
jgi:predicted nucleic acid-binding protein